MEEKQAKLPYRPPQITRILLRKEQAILTTCSTTKNTASTTGTKCVRSGCRRSTSGTADSTARS
jgi:hypothetical protein